MNRIFFSVLLLFFTIISHFFILFLVLCYLIGFFFSEYKVTCFTNLFLCSIKLLEKWVLWDCKHLILNLSNLTFFFFYILLSSTGLKDFQVSNYTLSVLLNPIVPSSFIALIRMGSFPGQGTAITQGLPSLAYLYHSLFSVDPVQ